MLHKPCALYGALTQVNTIAAKVMCPSIAIGIEYIVKPSHFSTRKDFSSVSIKINYISCFLKKKRGGTKGLMWYSWSNSVFFLIVTQSSGLCWSQIEFSHSNKSTRNKGHYFTVIFMVTNLLETKILIFRESIWYPRLEEKMRKQLPWCGWESNP